MSLCPPQLFSKIGVFESMIDIFGQTGSGEQIAREGDKGEGSLVGPSPTFSSLQYANPSLVVNSQVSGCAGKGGGCTFLSHVLGMRRCSSSAPSPCCVDGTSPDGQPGSFFP